MATITAICESVFVKDMGSNTPHFAEAHAAHIHSRNNVPRYMSQLTGFVTIISTDVDYYTTG